MQNGDTDNELIKHDTVERNGGYGRRSDLVSIVQLDIFLTYAAVEG